MNLNITIRATVVAAALALTACGGDNTGGKNNGGTNNGGTNNSGTNNGTTNNGTTNNGTTNNGTTNNGTTNNGTTNNGTNNTNNVCANVECAPPAPACVGDVAVTYTGDGTCDMTDGMCDFTAVVVENDCAANGQACQDGACVAIDPTPVPGKLVISEVMYDPRAVNDNVGEWFELYNASNHVLDLQGLQVDDDPAAAGVSFQLPIGAPIELAAGEYYVLGISDDLALNGGVPVDYAYTGFVLAQNADTISILDEAGNEVDVVNYDPNGAWPDLRGVSMQFGSEYDAAVDDNADPQFWCASRTPYGDGDFGSPGAANGSCAPVDVTIYAIQDENDANHPEVFQTVNVAGVVVTASDGVDYMWVQEQIGGEYSGLYVDVAGVDVSALAVGDIVDLSGTYEEFRLGGSADGLTGVTLSSITDTGVDATTAPEVLEVSAIVANPEPWENVLVQVVEAGVTDNLGFGEIEIDGALAVDDLLFDGFTGAQTCEIYASITGPLNYSFGAFKIEPRDAADIGAATTASPVGAVTIVNMGFTPSDVCVTEGTEVTWTNSDLVLHTVTSRLPTDSDSATNVPANPVLDLTLAPAANESYTFTDAGTYHYRCLPHPAMQGRVVVTAAP